MPTSPDTDMGKAGKGSNPQPMLEPRDHDAKYADRAALTKMRTQDLANIAGRHHAFKKQLTVKHPHMRENLKLLHMLSEHAEVDPELLAWLVRECQRAPENSMGVSYHQEALKLGGERHEKAVKDATDAVSRALNQAQVDVQQKKLEALKLSGPTSAHDPVLTKIVEIIASDGVVKDVTNYVLTLDNRYKVMYHDLCKNHKKPIPKEEERRAIRLLQYAQVREEFADEDNNGTPITTSMIWAWFRGERNKHVDGRAFWNAYAVLCGYVDDKGEPLPPNLDENGNKLPQGQQLFHCDHILCRKMTRTSTSDGSREPSYEVDHWSNYAIHWAAVNTDKAMWDGTADVISELKKWIHGLEACQAIEQSVAHRAQRLAANRKHTTKLLDKLGRSRDAQKELWAWVPSNRYQVLVGQVKLGPRLDLRKRPDYAAMHTGKRAKVDNKRPLPGQQQLGFPASGASTGVGVTGAGSSRAAADDSDTPETEEAGSPDEASASEEEKAPDGAHTPPGSPSHPAGESAKEAGSSGEPSASAESEKEEAPAGEPAAKKAKTGQTSNAQIGMSTCKVCKCEVEPGKKRATQVCRRHDKSSKCKNGCFNEAETRKDSKKLGKLALVRKNQSSGGRVGWCRRCDHLNADGDERKKAENAELSKKIAQECRNPS